MESQLAKSACYLALSKRTINAAKTKRNDDFARWGATFAERKHDTRFGGIPEQAALTIQLGKKFGSLCARIMSDGAEKHRSSLYAVKLYEAIRDKDEQTLAHILKRSTIETVLLFSLKYGISPLAYCIQTCDVSHLGLVRCLLRSGLCCDSEVIEREGSQTVLAHLAHARNDHSNFLERIIEIVIEGVDDATACYMMLKHNSLQLFKAFLAVKQLDENRLFESLASAVTKLNVKQFCLTPNLRMFVLRILGDYGYRHLAGDWMGRRECNSDEWKHHVDVISACWNHIAEKYDTGTYEDIDDRLLHELQVLHNHLYFLQHKPFLVHLPLRETIFCLAVFVTVFKHSPFFDVYRWMVHKSLVVDFVRMIAFQLVLVKKWIESAALELTSLMVEAESFIAPVKNDLIEKLLKKLECSRLANQQPPRSGSSTSMNSNKDAIIRRLMQRMKKVDKVWAEAQNKAIREIHRKHLIVLIEARFEHMVHPENVADQIMGRTKRNRQTADRTTIAPDIVASATFDLEHLMRGQDRRIRRKLNKCYDRMKQFHSLMKIITSFGYVAKVNRANEAVFLDSLKRVITVLGETMKSTKSSPNMPNGRLMEAMERMLTERFAMINILHRNNYARELSLSRLVQGGELERRVYSLIPNHTTVISMAINLLFVILLADIRRSFYGFLLRCRSLGQLRSLLIWIGEKDTLLPMQHDALQVVLNYFTNIKALFAELRERQVAKTLQFMDVDQQLNVQCSIVEELEAMLAAEAEFHFESLRKTCFACRCIATLRRILRWKIDSYHPNRLLETICTKWDPNVENLSYLTVMDDRLTWIDPTVITTKLNLLLSELRSADESHQVARTRELIQTLNVLVEQEEAILELNNMLRPYYNNIFCLDNKWKVLKSFCRRRQLPWDSTLVRVLRRKDQEHLQALFDERRGMLRSILEQNDIRMVEELDVGSLILVQDIRASLEHLQLELCKMLTAVGYFGDSFYYVKHRIPMIQGKNYRNLLAHDSLSYNLLTDTGDAKLIVNAYIFANTDVRLFDSGRNEPADLRFPTLKDTVGWVEEQQQLLAAIKANDLRQVLEAMRAGGEIKSFFCSSPNVQHYPATCLSITFHLFGICEPDPAIVALLRLYIPNLPDVYRNSNFLLDSAIVRRDFAAAFELANESEPFREKLYSWPNLMSRLSSESIVAKTALERGNLLDRFLDYGNEKCIAEMVDHHNGIAELDPATVHKAFLRGLRSTVEIFVPKAHRFDARSLELAIVMHWNDMLSKIAAKTLDLDDRSVHVTLLRTSIKANNVTAFVHLLNVQPISENALRECYLTATSLGRCAVLKFLLTHCPPMDRSVLATAIHNATLYNYWPCVRLLLDADAAVDVLIPGYQDAEANVLLLLVMYDQVRLVRHLKSVQRAIYGTLTEHPFSVAVRSETDSARMVRALGALGFGWLDSSTTLHEAILQGYDQPAWNRIWSEIGDQLASHRLTIASFSHCTTLHLLVLQRWKMIAFVEECSMDVTALGCAAGMDDPMVLRTLLDRMCSMRQIDDVGVLGDVVFLADGSIIRHCKGDTTVNGSVASCCEDMISRISVLPSAINGVQWQERTIDVGDVSILFAVPAHVQINEDAADLRFIDSSTLVESIQSLCKITDSMFTAHTIVHATFARDERTLFFLRIENVCCVYDLYAPGSRIDLTDVLNAKAGVGGGTALTVAVENKYNRDMVQLLVEMGANPLLADNHGKTPMALALDYNSPELALYLMDECLQRDLRSADGVSVLDVTDGIGKFKLIHTAAANGHEEVVTRLLQLQVDATARNVHGYTPAHIAVRVPRTTTALVKQLLDYDRTPVDMLDGKGATLLRLAAEVDSIPLLDLLMQYKPDLTLQSNRDALYLAIEQQHVQWAKRFLHHAIEQGVPKVTTMDDDGDDAVIMSLKCVDFELSRALLEYELGHPLERITESDRPRIEAVLKAATTKIPHVPVAHLLELKGLRESDNFLTFLRNLLKERLS